MTEHEQRKVCLLMNLGGIEMRLNEFVERAHQPGDTVYSLTGDGLEEVADIFYGSCIRGFLQTRVRGQTAVSSAS